MRCFISFFSALICAGIVLTLSSTCFGQAADDSIAAAPAPTLAEILDRAEVERATYLKEFRNLIATEDKSFRMFNRDGVASKHRDVKSTFIVYELTKDAQVATEFRNVLAVDGKAVEDNEKRAEDFFKKVVRASTAAAETSDLSEESTRYDLGVKVSGFTLFQSVVLDQNLRSYFDFKLAGRKTIDGHDVYVVSFKQTKFCPYIYVNAKRSRGSVPLSLAYNVNLKSEVDYKEKLIGTFYIDATSYAVRREERTMTIQPEGYEEPAIIDENAFVFTDSEFGILTPKEITHTQYLQSPKEKKSIKWTSVVFTYDKFTKPDVEIKASDMKSSSDAKN